jgi:L-lysine exporter family protein LysE/ArgO
MQSMNTDVLIRGFCIVTSLIVAIGPQNSFVFSQAVRCKNLGVVIATTIVCDTLLASIGIAGFGPIVSKFPTITRCLCVAALVWLSLNAASSFRHAWSGGNAFSSSAVSGNVGRAMLSATAYSLLNPHAYVDSVVLLGSFSSALPAHQRVSFFAGVVLGIAVWFISLGAMGRICSPLLSSKNSWRVVHGVIGISLLWSIVTLGSSLGQFS